MAMIKGTIAALPNEILIAILTTFPTASLLPLAATSHRFHALILRILETRLSAASTLASHTLILEVFHPATKLSTPYLFCAPIPSSPTPKIKCDGVGRLGEMREGYTSFRPLQPEADRLPRRPGPPLPTSTNTNASVATSAQDTSGEAGLVTQDIHLESHELFSQLCTITNLVKVGPKRGLFLSCVSVGEGILRIWRDWLAATAQAQACTFQLGSAPITQTGEKDQGAMLWADKGENVGLRMNIERLEAVPGRAGEDEAVSYRVGYEELVIRTSHLLLQVEASIEQEVNHSGQLCGLDYEFLPPDYEGDGPGESYREVWGSIIEFLGGWGQVGNVRR